MNLKKYIKQIYELRLIQSSKAFISFYKEIRTTLPNSGDAVNGDVMDFDKDGMLIENLYNKLVIKKHRLTNKEIDELLTVYLIYSFSINKTYQSKTECTNIERYTIYLMAVGCIYKYYQIESNICKALNIPKDIIVEDIINACLITRDLLTGLINYDLLMSGQLPLEENTVKTLSSRFKDVKEEDIRSIEQDVKTFTDDYLNGVLYPVQSEFDRQILYAKMENEMLMSDKKDVLENIVAYKNKSSSIKPDD